MAVSREPLIAERLTRLLEGDLAALEQDRKDNGPLISSDVAIKVRVEAVSQITRTLEKLIELRRLEALAEAETNAEDEAETERLREELLRRLRAVDARRGEESIAANGDARR